MLFVLSDESVNEYGFRVLSSGINLSDFQKNPIMLWRHDRDLLPIGKWVNIQVKGGKLIAEPELYAGNDPLINKIRGMLEQGIINAASISIEALETSSDPKLMLPGQTEDTVTRSRLIEVSLVDIPANKNAVKTDKLSLNGKVFSLSHKTEQPFFVTHKLSPMDLQDLRVALSLSDSATDSDILASVKKMQQELAAYKSEKAARLVDDAIKELKITAPQRNFFLNAAKSDYEATQRHLASLTPYKSIESKLKEHNEEKVNIDGKDRRYWSLTDWRKHAPEELRNNPELYKRLLEGSNEQQ